MIIFQYLIFPGFLFSSVMGLLAGWVDRKVSARLQWRVGPPWYQNFVDIAKLFGKEIIVPERSRVTFLLAPWVGLVSASVVATLVGTVLFSLPSGLKGDLIVVIYLLIIPALAVIMGGSSSGNPLAAVGVSREMKLILGYELPFLLSIITVIIKSHGTIQLEGILRQQFLYGSFVGSLSGFLAALVGLLCIQAKLGVAPFDISEAEQELMGGTLIEYAGIPLAVFRITKAVLLYTLPLFLVILFLGRDVTPLFLIAKYIGILVLIILIKNTNPRLRIDQALRFLWGKLTLLAAGAVVLALIGW